MPVVQSTYSETMPVALPGMPADADYSAATKLCETAAGIAFGVVVSRGTADKGAIVGGSEFVGVTIRDITQDSDNYDQYDNMGVMQRGHIWVTVGGNVAAGDDVTYNTTTGVLSSTAAGAGQVAIAGASWETTVSSGGFAKLRLSGNLPSA